MIIRVQRYLKKVKGKIFSVAAYTKSVNAAVAQKPLTNAGKRALAKQGLARARKIQETRARALGLRIGSR